MSAITSNNKQGTHLADAFDIFMSDFNILSTVGFPQPDISARSRTVCLLSLLMADSTFVTLPVLLIGGLPIRSAAGMSIRNLEGNLYSKAVMHSGDVRLALLTLKYRVVLFWTQNKITSLSHKSHSEKFNHCHSIAGNVTLNLCHS